MGGCESHETAPKAPLSNVEPRNSQRIEIQAAKSGSDSDLEIQSAETVCYFSPPDQSVLRRAFDSLDKQRTGFISRQELLKLFQSLHIKATPKQINVLILMLDSEDQGRLSFEDFFHLMYVFQNVVDYENQQLLFFLLCDVRHAGALRPDDMSEFMRRMGFSLTREQIKALMKPHVDQTDGSISYTGFLQMMRKLGQK